MKKLRLNKGDRDYLRTLVEKQRDKYVNMAEDGNPRSIDQVKNLVDQIGYLEELMSKLDTEDSEC